VAKEVAVDLWIINHFRVLPTEDRYMRLTERQKSLMITGYFENPIPDEARLAYRASIDADSNGIRGLTETDKVNLMNRFGYSNEQLDRIEKGIAGNA